MVAIFILFSISLTSLDSCISLYLALGFSHCSKWIRKRVSGSLKTSQENRSTGGVPTLEPSFQIKKIRQGAPGVRIMCMCVCPQRQKQLLYHTESKHEVGKTYCLEFTSIQTRADFRCSWIIQDLLRQKSLIQKIFRIDSTLDNFPMGISKRNFA